MRFHESSLKRKLGKEFRINSHFLDAEEQVTTSMEMKSYDPVSNEKLDDIVDPTIHVVECNENVHEDIESSIEDINNGITFTRWP